MPKIKAGVATWATVGVGILTALPTAVTTVITELENDSVKWTSGDKTALISGSALVIVGAVGRFAQAVAHIITTKGSSTTTNV